MAKLTFLAALFAALIAAATATTYTTVVTTTTEEAGNPRGQETECQQEIQQMRTRPCMDWMMGTGGRATYDETPFLRSAVANPRRFQEGGYEMCCSEMSNIPSHCRCMAIKQIYNQHREQHGERMSEVRRRAEMLPQMCQWDHPTQCSVSGGYY